MKDIIWKLKYAWMCAKRVPISFLFHPSYSIQITLRRLLFTITRRFVGNSIYSPITRESIFNVQSLVNAYSIQIIRELDGEWIEYIRETPNPVIFDVGSNIGQFSAYVKAFNPICEIYTVDCWPELKKYVPSKNHYEYAVYSKNDEMISLCKAIDGWTASTDPGYYSAKSIQVKTKKLDSIWEDLDKPDVALLKIDIDGAEIVALRGATEMLKKTSYVLIETDDLNSIKELAPNRTWMSSNNRDWCGKLN